MMRERLIDTGKFEFGQSGDGYSVSLKLPTETRPFVLTQCADGHLECNFKVDDIDAQRTLDRLYARLSVHRIRENGHFPVKEPNLTRLDRLLLAVGNNETVLPKQLSKGDRIAVVSREGNPKTGFMEKRMVIGTLSNVWFWENQSYESENLALTDIVEFGFVHVSPVQETVARAQKREAQIYAISRKLTHLGKLLGRVGIRHKEEFVRSLVVVDPKQNHELAVLA